MPSNYKTRWVRALYEATAEAIEYGTEEAFFDREAAGRRALEERVENEGWKIGYIVGHNAGVQSINKILGRDEVTA